MPKRKTNKLRILSFVVILYMLTALGWWSYLLYIKNNDAFLAKTELLKITLVAKGEAVDIETFKSHPEFILLEKNYKGQERMIIGEAIVLAISLMIGIWFINQGYSRQTQIARQSRNFLLSITHELKSPLASIRLILQTFVKRDLSQEQINQFSESALVETERLNTLVNNLLLAARMETSFSIQKEEIDLLEIKKGIFNKIETKGEEVELISNINESHILLADKVGFTSVLTNLVENAIKYSKGKARVEIIHAQDGKMDLFKVKDNGLGISNKEKNKVFDKFYRIGNEDTRKTKGTGLGLYIVRQIVEAHGGNISLSDNTPNGSIFTFKIPARS